MVTPIYGHDTHLQRFNSCIVIVGASLLTLMELVDYLVLICVSRCHKNSAQTASTKLS